MVYSNCYFIVLGKKLTPNIQIIIYTNKIRLDYNYLPVFVIYLSHENTDQSFL